MMPIEIVDEMVCYLGCDKKVRILLSGPCSVGKTLVAREMVSRCPDIEHIEHDSLKRSDGFRCMPSDFDADSCFSPSLKSCKRGFVIDLGGDTVFRSRANNEDRLKQMKAFKEKHDVTLVLLTAKYDVLLNRFVGSKDRNKDEFKDVWHNWKSIEEPYWRQCADIVIDTS